MTFIASLPRFLSMYRRYKPSSAMGQCSLAPAAHLLVEGDLLSSVAASVVSAAVFVAPHLCRVVTAAVVPAAGATCCVGALAGSLTPLFLLALLASCFRLSTRLLGV